MKSLTTPGMEIRQLIKTTGETTTMSAATPCTILKRIEMATPESRIAVFKESLNGKTFLDAIFADTINGLNRIGNAINCVGVYHKDMDLKKIKLELIASL